MKIVGGKNKQLFTKVDSNFGASSVSDVFLKYKASIIDELTKNLHESGKDQPGKLIQSVDVKIGVDGSSVSFKLFMEDYWKYVDEGVQGTKGGGITSQYKFKPGGKRIPLDSIKKFIAARGIAPTQNIKKGQQLSKLRNKKLKKVIKKENKQVALNSAAFAIGTAIKQNGIKPTYFFSDVINDELHFAIKKDLEKVLKKEIELSFTIN